MVSPKNSAQSRSLRGEQLKRSTLAMPRKRGELVEMSASAQQSDNPQGQTFATVLRHRRAMLSLSLGELADRVGCAKSYLSSMETGRKGPPTEGLIERLEIALSFASGELLAYARWDKTPYEIREDLAELRRRDQYAQTLAKLLTTSAQQGTSLDDLYASGQLREVIEQLDLEPETGSDHTPLHATEINVSRTLPNEVPLINCVTAGYPADFTDLGYPARTADEYIRTPDLNDPDAFAARVIGDSMQPTYQEGDIVVFSPAKRIVSGADCFVRFERDSESTFKRVYFEMSAAGEELIRIQPINNAYPPQTVPREQVAGLYAGVSVIRSIG